MFKHFEYNNQTFLNAEPSELLEAGVPQAEIDKALADVRLKAAKDECRRRIYTVASSETQMNMATAASVISSKTASTRSAEETAILTGVGDSLHWVVAMKQAAADIASDQAKDISDDANWPDCPANVLAVVEQF